MLLTEPYLGKALYHIDKLSKKLMARNLRLGTAESCTGGLMAALCTNQPGSSRWFAGGAVVYANDLKRRLLGVPEALLLENGAVSGPVAEAMAGGGLERLGVNLCLSVSGIAGPDGGTAEKPVGTVWIGLGLLADGVSRCFSIHRLFPGDRQEVRSASVAEALAFANANAAKFLGFADADAFGANQF